LCEPTPSLMALCVLCIAMDSDRGVWNRLYQTKLTLFAAITIAAGIMLIVISQWSLFKRLDYIPAKDVGSSLLNIGLFAVGLEYLDRKDSEHRDAERTRLIFREQIPALRDSVLEVLAEAPSHMNRLTPAMVDGLITTGLVQRATNEIIGNAAGTLALRHTSTTVMHVDHRTTVTLTPAAGTDASEGHMFLAVAQCSYRTNAPLDVLRFACVSSADDYARLRSTPGTVEAWLFNDTHSISAKHPSVFEVTECLINGLPQRIQREEADGNNSRSPPLQQPQGRVTTWPIHTTYGFRGAAIR
jgi:hypothetical protein